MILALSHVPECARNPRAAASCRQVFFLLSFLGVWVKVPFPVWLWELSLHRSQGLAGANSCHSPYPTGKQQSALLASLPVRNVSNNIVGCSSSSGREAGMSPIPGSLWNSTSVFRSRAFPGALRHRMIHRFVPPLFLTHSQTEVLLFLPSLGGCNCQWDFPTFQQTRDHSPVSPGNFQS